MEFSSFTFTLTEECNFDCSYCFQKKGKGSISASTLEKAIDFFLPFLKEECSINFYGGEPLLAFDRIRQAVSIIQDKNKKLKKNVQFSMTTNASLIDDEILEFLDKHKFMLTVSFDGLAQDISKRKGSFEHVVSVLKELLKYPDIDLETNSVFTPETIGCLTKSVQHISGLGVPNIDFSINKMIPWDSSALLHFEEELASVREFLLSFYRREEMIPLVEFREDIQKDIFCCFAGRDRMAITPDGKLWGCCLLPDFLIKDEQSEGYSKYCFGDLDSFIESHEKVYPDILSNYSTLRTDHYFTQDTACILCEELEECGVCPLDTAYSGSITKKVPSWVCEIKNILRREKKNFRTKLKE